MASCSGARSFADTNASTMYSNNGRAKDDEHWSQERRIQAQER
jgi:hypothetical protein